MSLIENLKRLYSDYTIEIEVSTTKFLLHSHYPAVKFKFNGNEFQLFVDDEYQDFRKNNPLLSLCLVLRELEGFVTSENYTQWCSEAELESANNQVKEYYSYLEKTYEDIENIIGTIDSGTSDFEFGLNTGEIKILRESENRA